MCNPFHFLADRAGGRTLSHSGGALGRSSAHDGRNHVFFEDNPYSPTAHTRLNNFDVTSIPLGQLLSVSLATPGKIFAAGPAHLLGLYKVRISNKGLAPIDYAAKVITSTLW